MSFLSLPSASKTGSHRSRRRRRATRAGKRFFRPAMQHLEDRTLLATDYWTGASAQSGGNDNWSNAGNWSAGLPGASTTVDFTSTESKNGTANVDVAETVGALDIDSTWGGTLTVSNALTISDASASGNFTLASGTINGNGSISADGSGSEWSGGAISFGTGSLSNSGTLSIATNNGNLSLTGTLNNTGTIDVTGTNNIYAQSNGTTITNSGTFDLQAAAGVNNYNGDGTFNNNASGILECTATSGVATSNFLMNDLGTIEGNSGTLELTGGGAGGTSASPGTIDAGSNATIILGGTFSGVFAGDGTGTVDLSNFGGASSGGVTLDVTGSGVQWTNTSVGNALGGTVTNSGTMTIATASGNLSLVGVLTNSATGMINVTGTEIVQANAGGAAIDNDGTFDFQTAAAVDNYNADGTFNNNASGILECTATSGAATSNFLVNDLGTIEGNSGTLELTGGGSGGPSASPGMVNAGSNATIILGGTFLGAFAGSGAGVVQLSNFTGSAATLNFTGSGVQWANTSVGNVLGGTVTNEGTMTIATANILSLNGTLTNNSTGSISVTGTGSLQANVSGAAIDNAGTFTFLSGATVVNYNGTGTFTNSAGATLACSAGAGNIATISFPVDSAGTIVGNSGTLELTDGGAGGTIASPGTVNAGSNATIILGGTFSGAFGGSGTGTVDLSNFGGASSGGVTLDVTGSGVQWANTSVGNALGGTVTNEGTMTIATASNLSLTGTLTNTNTGNISVTGTSNLQANVSGAAIDNAGTFTFLSGATVVNYNGTGTFTNNAGGTLACSAGAGKVATIAYPVMGAGTIVGNSGILELTGGGAGGTSSSPATVNAGSNATVILGGAFSGAFAGSGAGTVQLSNFTGSGATLDFTGSGVQWANTSVGNALGGTVTNEGTMTIATASILSLTGTLTNTNTGNISVTGTSNLQANVSGAAIDNAGTFTFLSGATVVNYNGTGTFTNSAGGTLACSAGSGNIATISFPVDSAGTIVGSSGTLELTDGGGGGPSTSSPGIVNAGSNATVILGGTFSGAFAGSGTGTVDLSNFTGAASGGATLDFTGSGVTLANTSVGSSLNGPVTNAGTLTFATSNHNVSFSGTLTNTGSISVTGTANLYAQTNGSEIVNDGTLTFQSGATMANYNGTGSLNNAGGTLTCSAGTGNTATISFPVTNTGTITVNSGTLALSGGESGSGTVQINNSATLSDSSGNLEFDGSQYLAMSSSSTLDVAGDLIGSTTNIADFSPAGTVVFDGSGSASTPQTLEAMSQDLGNVSQGYENNFDYGTLSLAHGTYVELVDNAQNVPSAGSQPDAVYCNELIVPSGCTLNLNGLHLYSKGALINGTILNGTVSATGPTTSNLTVTPSPTSTPPTLSATISDAGTTNKNIQAAEYFIGTAGSNGSGTTLAISGSGDSVTVTGTLTTAQFNALSPGTNTIYVNGEDTAGNWGPTASATFVVQSSSSAPTVTMTAPASGTDTSQNEPTLTATASDTGGPGLASVQFQYSSNGGGTWQNAGSAETSSPFSYTFSSPLADGNDEARAVATDKDNNTSDSAAVTFQIDTKPPATSNVSVAPSPTSTPPTINATVSDVGTGNSNIIAAEYFIGTAGSNGSGTALSGNFTSDTVNVSGTMTAAQFSALSPGTRTIYVNGEDAAGNWSPTASATFVVQSSSSAPTVTMTAPASGTDTNQNEPTLTATASDAGGPGLASVQFLYSSNGGGTWQNAGSAETSSPFSYTFSSPLADGNDEARAVATDKDNNTSDSTAVTFQIDTKPPATSNVSVTPSPTSTPPTISAGVSDVGTGNSNIIAAEYFIGTAGSNGSGTALSGNFTSDTVNVSGTMTATQFSALSPGTYTIYVNGKDAAGNWSPTASATFVVQSTASSPTPTDLTYFDGTNGNEPSGVIEDSQGDLFGTTAYGGPNTNGEPAGDGTVWKITAGTNTIETLAAFNGSNGYDPGTPLLDSQGNLFGVTRSGVGAAIDGTVWELLKGGTSIKTLATFTATTGSTPLGSVVEDSAGDLFGCTIQGGASGGGVVWELPTDTSTIQDVVSFSASTGELCKGLLIDSHGDLFGCTSIDGPDNYGTIFKVVQGSGAITTLAAFNGTNGANPGVLTEDSHGNFFGATEGSGSDYGTVFELRSGSTIIQNVASFANTFGISQPSLDPGNLVVDDNGNIFGTTEYGGPNGDGTVFEVPVGTSTINTLGWFNGKGGADPDGADPDGLISAGNGAVVGTTATGGSANDGTVFDFQVSTNQEPGPTTSNLTVTPSPTSTPPSISATISDAGTTNNNIVAAEYWIGTAGSNGSGTPLTGSFTGDTVMVSGTLTAAQWSALSPGTYTIYVNGEDADANWGPTGSTTFVVQSAAPAPAVSMTSPANGSSSTSTEPTLAATASDSGGPGLASVQFQYSTNGGSTWQNTGSALTSAPFSYTFTTPLAAGSYEARAIATDTDGDQSTSTSVTFTITAPATNVLFSDSFARPNATEDNLGQADLSQGGTGTYYYVPIFAGAVIDSHTLQSNGAYDGGVEFTTSSDTGATRGTSVGQDLDIAVSLMVPQGSGASSSYAGIFFRSRAAYTGDGIVGGEPFDPSGGYWVRLSSTGVIQVVDLRTNAVTAFTAQPASFNATVFHTLEVAFQGNDLQVALDGVLQDFNAGGNFVAIPPTGLPGDTTLSGDSSAGNDGTAGIAFGNQPNAGGASGAAAQNLIVASYSSIANLPVSQTAPASTVNPLPATSTTPSFTLSWTGWPGPGASSIASYSVFVSEDGGAFTAFQTGTTATSATFTGVPGHTYAFYSVATDNLGNVQPTPSAAQTRLLVAGPPTSTVNPLPATESSPSFTVSWSGGSPGAGATSITSYEIYVSENGGAFTPFLTNTTATSATFNGQAGDTFGFYSVATNNLGITQPAPMAAQATTMVQSPPPVIIREQPLFASTKKGGLIGFSLTFNSALSSATGNNAGNFQLDTVTTKKVKRKVVTVLKRIGFRVSYDAAHETVDIAMAGKQTFPTGGQLTVESGVTGVTGVPVAGTTVFAISKAGRSITPE